MVAKCEESAEYTWTLLSTEVYYGTWSTRHWVKQTWKWEVKCDPDACGDDPFPDTLRSNCQTTFFGSKSGVVEREVMLKDVKNPNLTPEQVAILKECHRCPTSTACNGRAHFLPCVKKSGVVSDLADLVDPIWMAGPPEEAECDSWVDGCDCTYIILNSFPVFNWTDWTKPQGKGRNYRDYSNEEIRVKRAISRGGEENRLW